MVVFSILYKLILCGSIFNHLWHVIHFILPSEGEGGFEHEKQEEIVSSPFEEEMVEFPPWLDEV